MKRRPTFPIPPTHRARDRNGSLFRPGTVTFVTVAHNDDCPRINGGHECRCNPHIFVDGIKAEVPEA